MRKTKWKDKNYENLTIYKGIESSFREWLWNLSSGMNVENGFGDDAGKRVPGCKKLCKNRNIANGSTKLRNISKTYFILRLKNEMKRGLRRELKL